MTPNEYQELALRTASGHFDLPAIPAADKLIHASLGLATEVGEFLDHLKRALFYKTPLDKTVEEIGDLLWYVALALDALGVTMETAMSANINKLLVRYPEKFTITAARNRDLAKEREAIE